MNLRNDPKKVLEHYLTYYLTGLRNSNECTQNSLCICCCVNRKDEKRELYSGWESSGADNGSNGKETNHKIMSIIQSGKKKPTSKLNSIKNENKWP